jgi:hypothetical protein
LVLVVCLFAGGAERFRTARVLVEAGDGPVPCFVVSGELVIVQPTDTAAR